MNTSSATPKTRSLSVGELLSVSHPRGLKLPWCIACRTLSTAQSLISGLPRTQAIVLDISSNANLERQVAIHDLVISLVPYIYHVAVIKAAIKSKTNVVTTSYISPAMRDLDAQAKEAGIVVLNEVGVDPGIDHLYAIKKIDEVHAQGGKVCALKLPSLVMVTGIANK